MKPNHALNQRTACGGVLGVLALRRSTSCLAANFGMRSGIVAIGLLPRAVAGR